VERISLYRLETKERKKRENSPTSDAPSRKEKGQTRARHKENSVGSSRRRRRSIDR